MQSIAQLFPDNGRIPTHQEARVFSEPFGCDLRAWWAVAPQGDWMLWVATACGLSERRALLVAAACVRLGYRFDSESELYLEPNVQFVEQTARGQVGVRECQRAESEADAYQRDILRECNRPNTLAAANIAGAVAQLTSAAKYLGRRADCIAFAVRSLGQLSGAGHYLKGDDSQRSLHFQSAEVVRRLVCPEELTLPES